MNYARWQRPNGFESETGLKYSSNLAGPGKMIIILKALSKRISIIKNRFSRREKRLGFFQTAKEGKKSMPKREWTK